MAFTTRLSDIKYACHKDLGITIKMFTQTLYITMTTVTHSGGILCDFWGVYDVRGP